MGQPITVINKASNCKEILSFELNRSITGMGHRNYFFKELAETSARHIKDVPTDDPTLDIADALVLKLFTKYGQQDIKSVHLNSNVITMELSPDSALVPQDVTQFLEELFLYYPLK